MNNAKLYQKSNLLQRRDADLLMNEFSSIFAHHKEHARLLDVGCGPGDVLIELLLPHLHHPHDSSMQIVGADISQEMVEYAREKYRSMSKFIRFLKVDIESDFLTATKRITGSDELKAETFDFVTSFYCLHWVQNQRWVNKTVGSEFELKVSLVLPSKSTARRSQISTNYSNPTEHAFSPSSCRCPSLTSTSSCPKWRSLHPTWKTWRTTCHLITLKRSRLRRSPSDSTTVTLRSFTLRSEIRFSCTIMRSCWNVNWNSFEFPKIFFTEWSFVLLSLTHSFCQSRQPFLGSNARKSSEWILGWVCSVCWDNAAGAIQWTHRDGEYYYTV